MEGQGRAGGSEGSFEKSRPLSVERFPIVIRDGEGERRVEERAREREVVRVRSGSSALMIFSPCFISADRGGRDCSVSDLLDGATQSLHSRYELNLKK